MKLISLEHMIVLLIAMHRLQMLEIKCSLVLWIKLSPYYEKMIQNVLKAWTKLNEETTWTYQASPWTMGRTWERQWPFHVGIKLVWSLLQNSRRAEMWSIKCNAKCCVHVRGHHCSSFSIDFPYVSFDSYYHRTRWYAYIDWVKPKENIDHNGK